jgi:HPt (histidine-containing phosphotransfer) domain-containing protein
LHRTRALILVALALALGLAVAACGGDGESGGEDPAQVLRDTFNNDQSVDSGSFDLSLKVDAEGDQGGTFEGGLGGPFQNQEGGFPQFDLDADIKLDASAQDFSGSAGLTSTGEGAFVNFQDTDYQVPQELFDQFSTSYVQLQRQSQRQGAEGDSLLQSLGIDPSTWLTDLSNEGTEDVDGTETVHISGQADVQKLVEDIKKIAENAPNVGAQRIAPQQLDQLDQLTSVIESADFDIYSGESDNLLRKLEADVELAPPAGAGGLDSVNLQFTLTISNINEPQTISAPSDAQPLASLLQQLGIDPGQLGGALRGGLGAGGALPQAGGSQTAPSGGASQAYLQCLQQAQGEDALSECAELLQ